MAEGRWDVPQTEEGLQTLLARLVESRAEGDEAALGYGLLKLSYLVKWVRSDNDQPPFVRAHALAQEALEIFRRLKDGPGQVRAIHAVVPSVAPPERSELLEEADRLAWESGDDRLIARSLAAKGRMGTDRPESTRLTRQALEIFLRLEERVAAAACYFSLAVHGEEPSERFENAIESARLYREANELGHAARSGSLAVMYGEGFLSYPEMEGIIRQELIDAQADGNSSLEGISYGHHAKLAEAKGDHEEAAKYLRWKEELTESDGLTPEERHQGNIEMTKQMIAMAKASGNAESVAMFKAELKKLRKIRFG